jgi:hypothetical protein
MPGVVRWVLDNARARVDLYFEHLLLRIAEEQKRTVAQVLLAQRGELLLAARDWAQTQERQWRYAGVHLLAVDVEGKRQMFSGRCELVQVGGKLGVELRLPVDVRELVVVPFGPVLVERVTARGVQLTLSTRETLMPFAVVGELSRSDVLYVELACPEPRLGSKLW